MALTKCRECGNQVSTKAEACPHCGSRLPTGTKLSTWLFGGLFAFIVVSCTTSMNSSREARDATPQLSPAQLAIKERKEREFQAVLAGARRLKAAMKKPEAFKLDSALMTDADVICYEYTSRNSFNDQRREVYVLSNTVSSGEAKHWDRHCAGKTGTDYSYARAALP